MKRFLSVVLCTVLMFGMMCMPVSAAAADPKLLSNPYDLTVTQMLTDEGHPFGGVNVYFKIDNMPYGEEDGTIESGYNVEVERKIGENGEWVNFGGGPTSNFWDGYGKFEAPNKCYETDTWTADYSKDILYYRARMVLYGEQFSVTASTPWSNVATVGIKEYVDNERLSGLTRIDTAIAVSKEGWPNTANTVILTRDDLYPDALTGTPLSKKLDAPILFTNRLTLTPATATEITRLKPQKVIILGGTVAVSQEIENGLKQSYEVQRIGGIDMYETAAKIAAELGYKGKAVIATGEDFHDALIAAPLAAYKGMPMLLTEKNGLPSFTKDALKLIAPTETIVVGRSDTVSDSVLTELTNAKRYSGSDFYQTAVVVAENFGADASKIFFATGRDFPDALTGSALAAKFNNPIIFVNDPIADSVKQYLTKNKSLTKSIRLLGGEAVIPVTVTNSINLIYK